MGTRTGKTRVEMLLDRALTEELEYFAQSRMEPTSEIVEAALASFLPSGDARGKSRVAQRLDELALAVQRMERDQKIAIETLALFIQGWMMMRAPSSGTTFAMIEDGFPEQFEYLVEAVSHALSDGNTFSKAVANHTAYMRGWET